MTLIQQWGDGFVLRGHSKSIHIAESASEKQQVGLS
jgi:hypothetical protein